jgi:hypothetical protein
LEVASASDVAAHRADMPDVPLAPVNVAVPTFPCALHGFAKTSEFVHRFRLDTMGRLAMAKFPDKPTGSGLETDAGRDTTSETAEKARQFAEQAVAGAVWVKDALEDAIVAHPLRAIGIAAAAGLLAAVLFRR